MKRILIGIKMKVRHSNVYWMLIYHIIVSIIWWMKRIQNANYFKQSLKFNNETEDNNLTANVILIFLKSKSYY